MSKIIAVARRSRGYTQVACTRFVMNIGQVVTVPGRDSILMTGNRSTPELKAYHPLIYVDHTVCDLFPRQSLVKGTRMQGREVSRNGR